MSAAYLPFVFGLSLFVLVLISGYLPFRRHQQSQQHHHESFGETLATGIFLGAAMMHILPESHQIFIERGIHYPITYLLAGITFLFFLWLEHLGKELYQSKITQHAFIGVAWIMLAAHSFFEGSALGLSSDLSLMLMLFLAIISHKWAEGFAMAVQLQKNIHSYRSNITLFVLYALMTPLGVFLGYHYRNPHLDLYSPICLAISAGTFLYFGTLHGLERCVMVQRCCNLKHFSYVILGFLFMAVVA
jgi:zinc transporter ZupT